MLTFTKGNLLEANAEALVNTVNSVGVMGKGIALMFKDRFPENMRLYAAACKAQQVKPGRMFVTRTDELMGPKWIINFPTKNHWKGKSRMEWIEAGLEDLKHVVRQEGIRSVAIPPLGAGNGGLQWEGVRERILAALTDMPEVEFLIYEPTGAYQNVAKRKGVEKLTPARALIAELIRRYLVLGIECSQLEVQKLGWFLTRSAMSIGIPDPLDAKYEAKKFGPYSDKLRHLLDGLDGSYLNSDKRIADSSPLDPIWFADAKRDKVQAYLASEGRDWLPALAKTTEVIDGFESPFGMELLSTVDWLVSQEGATRDTNAVMDGISAWPAGSPWAERKRKLFTSDQIDLALSRLNDAGL